MPLPNKNEETNKLVDVKNWVFYIYKKIQRIPNYLRINFYWIIFFEIPSFIEFHLTYYALNTFMGISSYSTSFMMPWMMRLRKVSGSSMNWAFSSLKTWTSADVTTMESFDFPISQSSWTGLRLILICKSSRLNKERPPTTSPFLSDFTRY